MCVCTTVALERRQSFPHNSLEQSSQLEGCSLCKTHRIAVAAATVALLLFPTGTTPTLAPGGTLAGTGAAGLAVAAAAAAAPGYRALKASTAARAAVAPASASSAMAADTGAAGLAVASAPAAANTAAPAGLAFAASAPRAAVAAAAGAPCLALAAPLAPPPAPGTVLRVGVWFVGGAKRAGATDQILCVSSWRLYLHICFSIACSGRGRQLCAQLTYVCTHTFLPACVKRGGMGLNGGGGVSSVLRSSFSFINVRCDGRPWALPPLSVLTNPLAGWSILGRNHRSLNRAATRLSLR